MTFQEAKDQVAKQYNYKQQTSLEEILLLTKTKLALNSLVERMEEAAKLYAKSKWDEACDAMRSAIIEQWDPDAASEFDSINDTTKPEFIP
jgi:hypothetical protein